jgi:hypothetical protein
LFQVLVLSGHADVLAQSSLLESLAERCDQAGAMNWLGYFLAASSFKGKHPYLVLMMKSGAGTSSPRLEEVHAAVLLFEYRVLGMPTGAFSTDDWAGFRTVIAPEAERAAMASMAADALLKHGAQIVLISYGHTAQSTSKLAPASREPIRWAWRTRPVEMALPLEPTLKATLAKLGKLTRRNLAYYRRRVEATMACEFVADAKGLVHERELEGLNAGALNRISFSDFRHQFESSCKLPGGFLLGLQSGQGRWLGLMGGWRQGGVTVVYWQMNTAGYEKLSIGTAMRSYFLEYEVGLGTKTLVYYGGSAHSIRNSFIREEVTDLIVRRRSWRAAALQGLAKMITSPRFFIRINSQLAQTIAIKDLDWHAMDAKGLRPEPQSQSSRLL